jgi:hypothetical protein
VYGCPTASRLLGRVLQRCGCTPCSTKRTPNVAMGSCCGPTSISPDGLGSAGLPRCSAGAPAIRFALEQRWSRAGARPAHRWRPQTASIGTIYGHRGCYTPRTPVFDGQGTGTETASGCSHTQRSPAARQKPDSMNRGTPPRSSPSLKGRRHPLFEPRASAASAMGRQRPQYRCPSMPTRKSAMCMSHLCHGSSCYAAEGRPSSA